MEKYLYTIGEVAEILGENVSLVRFWSNEFPKFIKPQRNAKGNRLYTKEDIETFKYIHLLVKGCCMEIRSLSMMCYQKILFAMVTIPIRQIWVMTIFAQSPMR